MSAPKCDAQLRLEHQRSSSWTWTRGGLRVLAFVALLGLAACSGSEDTSESGVTSAQTHSATADPQAVAVATGFVNAYSAFHLDRAATYLAGDADTAGLPGGALNGPFAAWFRATGFEMIPGACRVTSTTDSGTYVRCPFNYHALGSSEIGSGPYAGNAYYLAVKDGVVVRVSESIEYESNGFSTEVWEPFGSWVRKAHPQDVNLMYTDHSQSQQRVDRASIRLWEQHISEYVNEVKTG